MIRVPLIEQREQEISVGKDAPHHNPRFGAPCA
jgi:hypothetical protein